MSILILNLFHSSYIKNLLEIVVKLKIKKCWHKMRTNDTIIRGYRASSTIYFCTDKQLHSHIRRNAAVGAYKINRCTSVIMLLFYTRYITRSTMLRHVKCYTQEKPILTRNWSQTL